MASSSKRTTVYLDNDLHQALRLKAIATSKSLSELVNKAVRESLKRDKKNYNLILEIMSKPVR
jgi:predicted HicB family RNase H-like nuclease